MKTSTLTPLSNLVRGAWSKAWIRRPLIGLLVLVTLLGSMVALELATGSYFVFQAQLGYPQTGDFTPVSKVERMASEVPCLTARLFYPDLTRKQTIWDNAVSLPWTCRDLHFRLGNGDMIPAMREPELVRMTEKAGEWTAQLQETHQFVNMTNVVLEVCINGFQCETVKPGGGLIMETFGTDTVTWREIVEPVSLVDNKYR